MTEEKLDLKSLDVRITELENAVKKLSDSVDQVARAIGVEGQEAAPGGAPAGGPAPICSVCQICQVCRVCQVCQICQVCRVCQVCRICNVCYECSCGPCNV